MLLNKTLKFRADVLRRYFDRIATVEPFEKQSFQPGFALPLLVLQNQVAQVVADGSVTLLLSATLYEHAQTIWQ